MTWSLAGLVLSLFVAVFAAIKSRRPAANYYAAHVYGMTRQTHAIYAVISAVFAALFAFSLVASWVPAVPLLAVFVLIFIFYFSSFARGFSDEE